MHTHIHIHMYASTTCVCVCTHTCMHACTRAHTHTHTHTHTLLDSLNVNTVIHMLYVLLYCYSKDVRLPANLQRAMAAEAEATREAKAKVCSVINGVFHCSVVVNC